MQLRIVDGNLHIQGKVEKILIEKITAFGNGAKVGVPVRYRGRKAYIVIVEGDNDV